MVFIRIREKVVAATTPLAAMQSEAVRLQDTHGSWPWQFFEQLSPDEVQKALTDPHLARAEELFRQIREEGSKIPPGALAITTFQLGLLLHRQGRLDEARSLYEEVLRICRLQAETTDPQGWALGHALFRLAEMTLYEDRARGEALFAESRDLAHQRGDEEAITINNRAVRWFGLMGQPMDRSASGIIEAERRADRDVSSFRDEVLRNIATSGDMKQVKRTLLFLRVMGVLGLAAAVFVGIVTGMYLRSAWFGVLAALYASSAVTWVLVPLSPRRRRIFLRTCVKLLLLSLAATVLLQYLFGISWLSAIAGMAVMIEAGTRMWRRIPPEDPQTQA